PWRRGQWRRDAGGRGSRRPGPARHRARRRGHPHGAIAAAQRCLRPPVLAQLAQAVARTRRGIRTGHLLWRQRPAHRRRAVVTRWTVVVRRPVRAMRAVIPGPAIAVTGVSAVPGIAPGAVQSAVIATGPVVAGHTVSGAAVVTGTVAIAAVGRVVAIVVVRRIAVVVVTVAVAGVIAVAVARGAAGQQGQGKDDEDLAHVASPPRVSANTGSTPAIEQGLTPGEGAGCCTLRSTPLVWAHVSLCGHSRRHPVRRGPARCTRARHPCTGFGSLPGPARRPRSTAVGRMR